MMMRTTRVLFSSLLLTIIAAGCGGNVPRDNPYDPDAPPSVQLKARLEGWVVLEGQDTYDGVSVVAREAVGGDNALSYDTITVADGSYALEVPAGTFNLEINLQGYVPAYVNAITVEPADVWDVGTTTLTVARGALQGIVVLDDGGAPTGTVVSVVPLNIPNGRQATVLAAVDGTYYVESLAAGEYMVRAERETYAPAYTEGGTTVVLQQIVNAPDLRLYPSAAIVKIEVNDMPVQYTNTRDVSVALFPFVEFLVEMRVSEDPTFSDPAWDTDYIPFNTPVARTLADLDGERTMFAQFRDSLGFETDVFSGSVVLDRAEPVVTSLTINNGAPFLTVLDGIGEAAVSFSGYDTLAGIDAYRHTMATDFTNEPWIPRESTAETMDWFFDMPLGDDNGLKTVRFQLRDRAGNSSVTAEASIIRDKEPPVVGSPAIAIDPTELSPTGAVRSLDVTLILDVTGDRPGEPLYMALANAAGLDASAPFVPLQSPAAHTLQPGPDSLSREVCAIFKDEAGLLTGEHCIPGDGARTGSISGVVLLEGAAAGGHSGTVVDLLQDGVSLGPSTVTAADGSYSFPVVSAGPGYGLHFSHEPYVAADDLDFSVLAGVSHTRAPQTLRIPKASITGQITYSDRGDGQHGGIVIVEATERFVAVTGPSGRFALNNLPASEQFELTARAPGYYTAQLGTITGLGDGEVYDLGTLAPLQPQAGDFRICDGNDDWRCQNDAIQFTSNRTVLLELVTTQQYWRASLDSTFGGDTDPWLDYVAQSTEHYFTFDIAEADGPKTIFVQYSDGAGTIDPTLSGSVILDTTPPVPAAVDAIVIDPDDDGIGATYSNHPVGAVLLSLDATDQHAGVSNVLLANTEPAAAPDFGLAVNRPYASTVTHNLDITNQGERWVYVQFCDAVDNCADPLAAPGDSIIYDTIAPNTTTGVGLTLYDGDTDPATSSGDSITNSPFIIVGIDTGDSVAIRYGNTESLTGADLIAVNPGESLTFMHILPLGEGDKTVYAQFVDEAGNASGTAPNPNNATIELDTAPPTGASLTLAEGLYTNQDFATAEMVGADSHEYILHVGDNEDFSGETWQDFTGTSPTWLMSVPTTFPPTITDRTYTFYAKLRDVAGNETQVLSRQITRDTLAPELPNIEIVEGAFTSTQRINLDLRAVGASDMIIQVVDPSDGTVMSTESPAYMVSYAIDLPPTPGDWRVEVVFVDAAGNATAPVSATTTYDGSPPENVVFSIDDKPYTNSTTVTLSIDADGATSMKLSNRNDFAGATWEPWADTRIWTLVPGDGTKTVYLILQDEAGNPTPSTSDSTELDTTPPAIQTVEVNGGVSYVNSRTVDIDIGATDTNGVDEIMIANDAAFSGGGWEAYTPPTRSGWQLTDVDGPKTVFVRFKDVAGNVSERADVVTLDTTPPTATLMLGGGALAIGDPLLVPVAVSASADVSMMLLVEGLGVDCSLQTIDVPFNGNTTHSFGGSPADGPLQLTVCIQDHAGWTGSGEATILLDRAPPTVTTFLANGGDDPVTNHTNNSTVTLTIAATDATSGIDGIRIANQQDMTGVPWEQLTGSRTWTLESPGTDGPKTVWLEVRDLAGQVRDTISAGVTLDTVAPSGNVSVVEGEHVPSADINVAVSGGDATTDWMSVAQGFLDCSGATYVAFAAGNTPLTLGGGDGLKTVSLCLKDRAGNTAGFSTAVTLDTLDPGAVLQINAGATYTTDRNVTLNISTDPDVVELKIADGDTIDCTTDIGYDPLDTSANHTLPDTDGLAEVSVCLRDRAERWASTSDTITLDQVPPFPVTFDNSDSTVTATGILINDGATQTNEEQVLLTIEADDATSGVTEMKISNNGSCSGGVWQDYVQTESWFIETGDNVVRTVSILFRDAAGLVSAACSSDTITIDTVNPTVTIFQIEGGGIDPEYTDNDQIIVTNLTYVGDCATIELSEDQSFTGVVRQYPCDTTWPTDNSDGPTENDHYVLQDYAPDGSVDGVKYIYARIVDPAGNESPAVVDTVILDTGGPTEGAVIINDGDTYTANLLLTLQFIAQGATEMKVTDNETCSGGTWETIQSLDTLPHSGPVAGVLWVSAEFRDDAGNGEGTCYNDSILFDDTWTTGTDSVSIVAREGNDPYTTSTEVDLVLTAAETAGVDAKISNGNACSGGSWEPYVDRGDGSMDKAWTLASGGEGTRYVSAIFRDPAGNTSACEWGSIPIDTVPPSGVSLQLDNDAEYSTSTDDPPTVDLDIGGTGISHVMLSEDPAFGGGEVYQALVSATSFDLTTANGIKTVYLLARDAAGNEALSLASDSIILDNQAPTGGSVVIDNGATYTTDTNGYVQLALEASDNWSGVDTVGYQTSADGSTWSGWTDVQFQPTLSIQLAADQSNQDNVQRWVEVRFTDRAGNVVDGIIDSIQLDNVAPSGPSVVIDGDNTFSTDTVVVLALSATATTTVEMQISNGVGCVGGGSWQAFASPFTWTLDGGGDDLTKTVSAKFRDAAGNETSCVFDTIQVDNVAPIAQYVSIEDGATYTNTDPFNLTIVYSGNPVYMYIAESEAALDLDVEEPPATNATFDASLLGEGTINVFVRFEDDAGNVSNTVLDSIIRDVTGPTNPAVTINGGAAYATSTAATVNLTLSAVDANAQVAQMQIRNQGSPTWPLPVPFAQSYNGWVIGTPYPAGDDAVTRTVEVQFIDSIGNVSATTGSDDIVLDNVPPGDTKSIEIRNLSGGTVGTNDTLVRLILSASGNPATMVISNNNSCAGGVTYAYDTSAIWSLSTAGDGVTAWVSVRFYDAAGNVSSPCIFDDIIVDTEPPLLNSITLDGRYNGVGALRGPDPNDTNDCYIAVTAADVTGAYDRLQFAGEPTFQNIVHEVSFGTTLPVYDLALPSGPGPCDTDGIKTIFARAIDTAGNPSDSIATDILLDREMPQSPGVVINAGDAFTNGLSLTVEVFGIDPGGIDTIFLDVWDPVLENDDDNVCNDTDANNISASWDGEGTTVTFDLPGAAADGLKRVLLCLMDGAGNRTPDDNVGAWPALFDAITLDRGTPTIASLGGWAITGMVTGGSATGLVCTGGSPSNPHWIRSPLATLYPTASDTYSDPEDMEMKIAEDNEYDAVSWQPYDNKLRWTVTSGDGPKTIGLKVRDALDHEATVDDALCMTLDTI
ncbi:hypothetical protein ACFL6C_09910, partial [Myxococcota bacterium]